MLIAKLSVLAGAKVAGKDLVFMIGSPLATVGIFDPNMSELADEIDVTDSESSGGKEYLTGFTGRTLTYSQWFDDTDTALITGDEKNFSWKIGSDTYSGSLIITGRELSATREDAHRWNYTARIDGALGLAP